MIDIILEHFRTEFPHGVQELLSQPAIVQILLFVVLLFLALVLKKIAQSLLLRWQKQLTLHPVLKQYSWMNNIFLLMRRALLPLAALILGQVTVSLFTQLNWPYQILDWAIPFLLLWLVYRVVVMFLTMQLPVEQANVWRHQILPPIVFMIAALHAIGLLDDFWEFGVPISGIRLTVGPILMALLIIYLSLLLSSMVRDFLGDRFLPGAGIERSATEIIATLAGYAIIVTGLFTALSVVGIPLNTFTIIAGGLSVGLGFGLQELMSNFVTGFVLLFEGSIRPGDVIRVGDTVGMVEDIGIRSMRITDIDNVNLIIPNNRFLSDTVTNFSQDDPRVRLHVAVGVSYDAIPREVEQALLEAAKQHPYVLEDPVPSVYFTDFGDNSLNFDLLVWTDNAIQIAKLSSDLRYHIWDALTSRQIEIPFPQRDIHIRSASGIEDVLPRKSSLSLTPGPSLRGRGAGVRG